MSASGSYVSADIDRSKFSSNNLAILRKHFSHLDDSTLARYLVAKNDNFVNAVEQLENAERLKHDYWNIRKEQCIGEIRKGTAYIHGHDIEGRPLIVVHARMHDPVNRNLKEMILMTLWWTELAISMLPDGISRFTILLDRDNCENALDTEYMTALANIFQDLHPERLHRAIVYPTGIVYYSLWNLALKWFMEEHTRDKVFPAVSLDDLRNLIPDEFIPQSLGGSSTYVFRCEDFSYPERPPPVHDVQQEATSGLTREEFTLSSPMPGLSTHSGITTMESPADSKQQHQDQHQDQDQDQCREEQQEQEGPHTPSSMPHLKSSSTAIETSNGGVRGPSPSPTTAVLHIPSRDAHQKGLFSPPCGVDIEELLEMDETRSEPDHTNAQAQRLALVDVQAPTQTRVQAQAQAHMLDAHGELAREEFRKESTTAPPPLLSPLLSLSVSYVAAREFQRLSKSTGTHSFSVAAEDHPLLGLPLTAYTPAAALEDTTSPAPEGDEGCWEEYNEESVWNDVESVEEADDPKKEKDSGQAAAVAVAATSAAAAIDQQVDQHAVTEWPVSPLSSASSDTAAAQLLLSNSAVSTSESYHYNLPPAVILQQRQGGAGAAEGATAASEDDDNTCLEVWHEVESVTGQNDQDLETFAGSGTTAAAAATPSTAMGASGAVGAAGVASTTASTSAVGVTQDIPRTAYLLLALSVVWCSLVVAAGGAVVYCAYNPSSVTFTVSGTVLAQLVLLIMLVLSFLDGHY